MIGRRRSCVLAALQALVTITNGLDGYLGPLYNSVIGGSNLIQSSATTNVTECAQLCSSNSKCASFEITRRGCYLNQVGRLEAGSAYQFEQGTRLYERYPGATHVSCAQCAFPATQSAESHRLNCPWINTVAQDNSCRFFDNNKGWKASCSYGTAMLESPVIQGDYLAKSCGGLITVTTERSCAVLDDQLQLSFQYLNGTRTSIIFKASGDRTSNGCLLDFPLAVDPVPFQIIVKASFNSSLTEDVSFTNAYFTRCGSRRILPDCPSDLNVFSPKCEPVTVQKPSIMASYATISLGQCLTRYPHCSVAGPSTFPVGYHPIAADCTDPLNAQARCEFAVNVTGPGCTTPAVTQPPSTTAGPVLGSTPASVCNACPVVCYNSRCLTTCPTGTEIVIINGNRECIQRPDPPKQIQHVAESPTVLKLNLVPATQHDDVTNYRVKVVNFDTRNQTAVLTGLNYDSDPALRDTILVRITDLTPGATYLITAQAFNGYVSSRDSSTVVARMPSLLTTPATLPGCQLCATRYCYHGQCVSVCPQDTTSAYQNNIAICVDLPDPPRDVQASKYNQSAILIKWNPPAASDVVRSYRISYSPYSSQYVQPTTVDVGLPYQPIVINDRPVFDRHQLAYTLAVVGTDDWVIRIKSFDGNYSSRPYSPTLLVRMNNKPRPTFAPPTAIPPSEEAKTKSSHSSGFAIAGVACSVIVAATIMLVLLVRARQLRRYAVGGRGYEYDRAVRAATSQHLVEAPARPRLALSWDEEEEAGQLQAMPPPQSSHWEPQQTVLVGPGVQMFDYDSPSDGEDEPDASTQAAESGENGDDGDGDTGGHDDEHDDDDGPDDLPLSAARRRSSRASGSNDTQPTRLPDGEQSHGAGEDEDDEGLLISLGGGQHVENSLPAVMAEDE